MVLLRRRSDVGLSTLSCQAGSHARCRGWLTCQPMEDHIINGAAPGVPVHLCALNENGRHARCACSCHRPARG